MELLGFARQDFKMNKEVKDIVCSVTLAGMGFRDSRIMLTLRHIDADPVLDFDG